MFSGSLFKLSAIKQGLCITHTEDDIIIMQTTIKTKGSHMHLGDICHLDLFTIYPYFQKHTLWKYRTTIDNSY